MVRHRLYHQMVTNQLFENRLPATLVNNESYIQDVSGIKVNIFEGASIDHCERKGLHEHVSNSEWLLEESCLNPQMQKHFEWQ